MLRWSLLMMMLLLHHLLEIHLPLRHSSPVDQPQSLVEGQTRRQIVQRIRLIEECNVAFALSVVEEVDSAHEPLNYSKAILSVDSEKWMGAMHEEMESFQKNGTWDIVCFASKEKDS
jgi:hypothetical protein